MWSSEWGDAGWWNSVLGQRTGFCSSSRGSLKRSLGKRGRALSQENPRPLAEAQWECEDIKKTKGDDVEEMCKNDFAQRRQLEVDLRNGINIM